MAAQNNVSLQSGRNVTFVSWNVRGLNNPVKRGKVLSHLKTLGLDIVFLQETHLKDKFIHDSNVGGLRMCTNLPSLLKREVQLL